MNLTTLALVLLLLHLLVCLLLWRMVRKGLLDAQGYFLPFMLLIPFWGPICVLLLTTRNALTDRLSPRRIWKSCASTRNCSAAFWLRTMKRVRPPCRLRRR